MTKLSKIISKIGKGEIDPLSALHELGAIHSPEKLDFAKLDHSRKNRCGFPEFIYGEGKTPDQIVRIIHEIRKRKHPCLVTRLPESSAKIILGKYPNAFYDGEAKVLSIFSGSRKKLKGNILIVTAGTVDIPVALEAKYTAQACGCNAEIVTDVGVAGIHRLLSRLRTLHGADVLIVVAGMEGALPSVVAGLVSCPVIAVPTSAGYGASLHGLTALFAMLNSCANGVVVTNINNGFGAACAAARIMK
ncbi:MAG: nickel pincer cofactor biosynthesis protein LarB [Victivallales bacterium]